MTPRPVRRPYRMPTWVWLGLLAANVTLIVVLLIANIPTGTKSGRTVVTVVRTVTAQPTAVATS